jgi:hypothetical protein
MVPKFWIVFFRLQAVYLLLWSIVERYTAGQADQAA